MKPKQNLLFPVLLISAGVLCICYDFLIIILFPGTFLDNLISFSHIWLVPGIFLIVCGIFRLKNKTPLTKSLPGRIRTIFYVLAVCFTVTAGSCLFFILTPDTEYAADADYIFVLGGGIDKNGKLSPAVIKRLELAADYLKANDRTLAVVTGGTVNFLPYAEAPAMKEYLMQKGIEDSRILQESGSRDTIQNFLLTLNLISETFGIETGDVLKSRITVVTSGFHLARALRIARRIGFTNITGMGSGTPVILIPHLYLREIAAYVKLNLRILLTGKPEKLAR